jgi:hypothetical protein
MSDADHPNSLPRPPGVRVMRGLGLEPDPWQVQVLESRHARLLLCCCRQAGGTPVAASGQRVPLALVAAPSFPGSARERTVLQAPPALLSSACGLALFSLPLAV